jgi:hypothetical protein
VRLQGALSHEAVGMRELTRENIRNSMDFSQALLEAKSGKAVYRKGWNGKGMTVSIQRPDDNSKMSRPYLYMAIPVAITHQFDGTPVHPDGIEFVPWLASQTDLMAEDWELAEDMK